MLCLFRVFRVFRDSEPLQQWRGTGTPPYNTVAVENRSNNGEAQRPRPTIRSRLKTAPTMWVVGMTVVVRIFAVCSAFSVTSAILNFGAIQSYQGKCN